MRNISYKHKISWNSATKIKFHLETLATYDRLIIWLLNKTDILNDYLNKYEQLTICNWFMNYLIYLQIYWLIGCVIISWVMNLLVGLSIHWLGNEWISRIMESLVGYEFICWVMNSFDGLWIHWSGNEFVGWVMNLLVG